ncbi:DUF998 domain-containing protein [Lysobacter maris]|uniref:DUF998 domain-containing protein n=1 Tax=Marilutibacter maris TaxID=1605891 RepID=A0A508A6M6_9GAMM|nr:DUF998 domain-containing protein [Lysobacter maris]KAB8165680.1 DUF998 domain-containing protein [Lysobacter maris]
MKTGFVHRLSWAPILAAASLLLAAVGFGLAADGYSHARHPLALLGARGMGAAGLFNVLAWILPGLLLAAQAAALRECLSDRAGFGARIGAWLLLLSALAFAAQGVWPLDPHDLEGPDSRRHALGWMLWWIAHLGAGALLVPTLMRQARWRRAGVGLLLSVLLLLAGVLAARAGLWPALAGRLAIVAWLGGYLACGIPMRRGA